MRFVLSIVLLFTLVHRVVANQEQIDQLNNKLVNATDENEIAELNSKLCILYAKNSNYNTAIECCNKSLKINQKLGNKQLESKILNNLGLIFDRQGKQYKSLEFYKKSLKIKQQLNDLSSVANTENNIGAVYTKLALYNKAITFFNRAITTRRVLNDSIGVAKSINNLGLVYERQGNYDKAITSYLSSIEILEVTDTVEKTALLDAYINLGNLYQQLNDYEKSLSHYYKVLKISRENNLDIHTAHAYNNIGNIYLKTKDYDHALNNFNSAIAIKKKLNELNGLAISYANKASVYQHKMLFDSALIFSQQSLTIHSQTRNLYQKSATLKSIGEIYLKMNKINKAEQYLIKSAEVADSIYSLPQLQKAYLALSHFYESINNTDKALHYFKEQSILKDSILNLEKQKAISEIETKYKVSENEKTISQLNSDNLLKRNQLTKVISGLILCIFLAISIISIVILKKNKERELFKKNNEMLSIKMDYNQKLLKLNAQNLMEKNKVIEELNAQLISQEIPNSEGQENHEELGKLLSLKIISDKDWDDFKAHFENVFPGFIMKLRNTHSNLTAGEQRLFLLTKLKFDSKEIANILGISMDSVRKSRYRLKKKLQLEEDTEFEQFVLSFT